jgi:aminopeptidase N
MSMNVLANEMGRDRLSAAFRAILRDFRDRRLSWDDFLAVVTRAAGRDMSWFYTQWFQRTGAPELVAERVDSAPQIMVRQPRDSYRLTVELAIFGAGCGRRSRITVAASEERVLLPGGCRADSVIVDPDYQILRWTPELRARFDRRD